MSDATRTSDPNADPVCAFYTDHPYPPPVENLDRARDEWRDERRHRAEFHLLWPDRPYRADIDILVAGCGTRQAARYALCRPNARVTGIDVSATSLEHTGQLKRQYNLTNLDAHQLAIEQAGALDHRFDLIVCTGVLHHLADPDEGLRALGSVLKPDGVIYLMVYAPYGRAAIYMLQDYCRRLGIGTSDAEIAELVTTLKALPQRHPLWALLSTSRDAQSPDALADALLNPRDRSYSVPQLFDFLDRGGLTLKRWYWQAPYLPQCGSIAGTSHASRLAALPDRERYAAMELWRGSMTAHSVIVSRDDTPGESGGNVRFDDDERWWRYVPHRLPATLSVQERLPAGAAGVLLNRSHPHPDLILPIAAHEKRLYDVIDGRLTIAAIVERERRDGNHKQRAREFFEKLWCYDQVVFDMTAAAGTA